MGGAVIDRILAHRNRFPALLNSAIDYVADHPMGILGRVAAWRMGTVNAAQLPGVSAAADRPVRVLIAPVNYSGQGRLWAASLEASSPSISARNMAIDVPGGFSFPADLVVSVPAYHNSAAWQQQQLSAARGFSHVLIEAEEPPFGRLFERDLGRQVAALLDAGVNVAFMCHGTDVRLPSKHRDRTPWSPYRDPRLYVARLERLARGNLDIIRRFGRPTFVSTPDLLWDVPGAIWCPVVVEPVAWSAPLIPVEPSRPLRVVHAPSSALIKGTQLIEPVLHRLHEAGIIDYRPVVGVASALMPDVYREADVVLDQFRLGSYGVAACEAMAAGRLVLGHVLGGVREIVRHETGRELPIVESTPDILEAQLTAIAADRVQVHVAGRAGIEFVAEVHDGRRSADILRDGWLDLGPDTTRESASD